MPQYDWESLRKSVEHLKDKVIVVELPQRAPPRPLPNMTEGLCPELLRPQRVRI